MVTVAAKKNARKVVPVTRSAGVALAPVSTVASYNGEDMTELALGLHIAMMNDTAAQARYEAIYGTPWVGFDVACRTVEEEIEAAFSLAMMVAE